MKTRLNIPVELCHHAVLLKEEKLLTAYITLNLFSNGFLGLNEAYKILETVPGFSSRNSQKKYLHELQQKGYVGWDNKAGRIYIRSVATVCKKYGLLPVLSIPFTASDLTSSKELIYGAVIAPNIRKQKAAIYLSRGKKVSAAKNREASLQKPYPGLSIDKLATMWQCSRSEAVKRKSMIEDAGYVKTIPHKRKLAILPGADFGLRKYYEEVFQEKGKGIHFSKDYETGEIWVLQQLCDEIVMKKVLKKVRGRFKV